MTNILFICHGNICRSTMAQFVFADMVKRRKMDHLFIIDSAATSREEIGNPPHHGTVRKCREKGVPVLTHYATQMTRQDYDRYDYLIGMDTWNIRNMLRILGNDPDGKVHKLLEFADSDADIADPWYTGDFEATYQDVVRGCEGLLKAIVG
ncbi:MAG: low molecular weight phosphotyrosine protein phosphatase [Clostridia bacterium]|nr:low molecular weight phosphotyrosine protein phosphatase [Clostridia bacterium]